jgi:hypothetical protein
MWPGRRSAGKLGFRGIKIAARPAVPLGAPITTPPAIDYALPARRTDWLSHPVLGDLSFDAFVRRPRNPVLRGRPPVAWPVNGFLFIDPVSGDWFVYAGVYPRGYFFETVRPPTENIHCTVHRSRDAGASWEACGRALADLDDFCYAGDVIPAGLAPDVSVVYHDGRYHMVFDWVSNTLTRAEVGLPADRARCDSGIGYAWSDRPEGPFQRASTPLLRNSAPPDLGFAGKYRRFYASTLVRRTHDWLVLMLVDTPAVVAWGLAGMTAARPEGPYSEPRLLLHVEDARYQPSLIECFPAFVHAGWLYSPGTSVAANRSFQILHRVRPDEAMDPAAWELWQHGSVWHDEPVENETAGIWGQTFSGSVDARGKVHALFPSRDAANCGTLNLATRDWAKPYRERGAVLSAPEASALACLRWHYAAFRLEADFALRGDAEFMWDFDAPLGPDRLTAGAGAHALTNGGRWGLQLKPASWQLARMDSAGVATVVAEGSRAVRAASRLAIERGDELRIRLDGVELWRGVQPAGQGALACRLAPGGRLELARLEVQGQPLPGRQCWLCTEALQGAGQDPAHWELRTSPLFRHGLGAVHRGAGGRAKWNFIGGAVALWSPRGPRFGRVEVWLDGRSQAALDLRAPQETPSRCLWRSGPLSEGPHTLVLTCREGGSLVVDACEFACQG